MRTSGCVLLVLSACATTHGTTDSQMGHRGWLDVAAIVGNINAHGLMPVEKRNVKTIVSDCEGSLALASHLVYERPVEDLVWTSSDGSCSVKFEAMEPDSGSFTDVLIRCDAPTRRHAEDMLLKWLAQLDSAYARQLRRELPNIPGEFANELIVRRVDSQTRVRFDARQFEEGWVARIDLH